MNEEDQNPMLPNLRDEFLNGMNSVVKGIFIGFAICVAAIIVWFIFSVTRPAKPQPEFENMPMLWTNGYIIVTNRSYPPFVALESEWQLDDSNAQNTVSYHDSDGDRWLWSSVYTNNWHWTNVMMAL